MSDIFVILCLSTTLSMRKLFSSACLQLVVPWCMSFILNFQVSLKANTTFKEPVYFFGFGSSEEKSQETTCLLQIQGPSFEMRALADSKFALI